MILYFLKSTACLFLLWGFYKLVLENEKMHVFNRFFLLGSLVLGLTVPLFHYEFTTVTAEQISFVQPVTQFVQPLPVIQQVTESSFTFTDGLLIFYVFVTLFFLFRFLRNILLIIRKTRSGKVISQRNYTLIISEENGLPCSFWKYIFISQNDFKKLPSTPELLIHEECHIIQKHSLDVLFVEILLVVLWFNPVLYLYRTAIKLNHEFVADEAVLNARSDVFSYQNLLLSRTFEPILQLSSSFNFQLTKQRFIMMTKQTSARVATLKKAFSLPLLLVAALLFSEFSVAQTTPTKPATPVVKATNPKSTSGKLTKEDVDYRNGGYMITQDFIPGKTKSGWGTTLKYSELTDAEKTLPFSLMYFEKTPIPTDEMYNNWLNPKVVGLWINDKRVQNSELKKYQKSDIAHYYISKLAKNAINYGKHYYQVDLMTHEEHDKYIEGVKKNPFFSVDLRTKK